MSGEQNYPCHEDTVTGDSTTSQWGNAMILGGLEGVRQRFRQEAVAERKLALNDAVQYGKEGLELIISALQDYDWQIQHTAYLLLKASNVPEALQAIAAREFEFECISLSVRGREINRYKSCTAFFQEDLGDGESIQFVAIPAGSFRMGSPEIEEARYTNEEPVHEVDVFPFFMGKYPVTQIQWWTVASSLPQVNRPLKLAPSGFKDAERPVECVSWHDAVEFCDRLSRKTGRTYRLPSEAEWEYACRAGTTTPFHVGHTITSDIVNFKATEAYGFAAIGAYREHTNLVGSMEVANSFGLYDMHGNVWEWCADTWHDNYYGAPTNGSAWELDGDYDRRLVKGGSWYSAPWGCRSANRWYFQPDSQFNNVGFRLVVSY